MCKVCINWKESVEPNVEVPAPPSETLGPTPVNNTHASGGHFEDPEMGFSDSDEEYEHMTAVSCVFI
jgi:hypothetical protein